MSNRITKILNGWKIDVDAVPKLYTGLDDVDLTESIDLALAKIILESKDERIKPSTMEEWEKMVPCIDPATNTLTYRMYIGKCGLGRRQPTRPRDQDKGYGKYRGSLITTCKLIKNTIFLSNGWIDIDLKKAHPSLMLSIAKRNEITAHSFETYIGEFDRIASMLIEYYTADKSNPVLNSDIKKFFNRAMFGGGHPNWVKEVEDDGRPMRNKTNPHEFIKAYRLDFDKIKNKIIEANPDIGELVCTGDEDEYERGNRILSYFAQIIENHVTWSAMQWLQKNGYLNSGQFDWGWDGLTIPPFQDKPVADMLGEMNAYLQKTLGLKYVVFEQKLIDPSMVMVDCIQKRKMQCTCDACEDETNLSSLPYCTGVAQSQKKKSLKRKAAAVEEDEDEEAEVDDEHEADETNNPLFAHKREYMEACLRDGISDFGTAQYLYKVYGSDTKFVDKKTIYKFNDIDGIWEFQTHLDHLTNLLSTQITEDFRWLGDVCTSQFNALAASNKPTPQQKKEKDRLFGLIDYTGKIVRKNLGQTKFKQNVMVQYTSLPQVHVTDFELDMNKELYVLPLKGKQMLDLRTNTVYPRTSANKFNYQCPASYLGTLSPEDELFAHSYFADLFVTRIPSGIEGEFQMRLDDPKAFRVKHCPENVQCVMDIIKTCMIGKPSRFLYIFHGEGCNGKSVFFKLIEDMFGSVAMQKASKDLLIEKKHNSPFTGEAAVCDRARLVVLSETEEGDKLSMNNIKQITGGDKIEVNKKYSILPESIDPTCSLVVISNNLPKIPDGQAVVDRLVTIPAYNRFTPDSTFYQKLLEKMDVLFTYIINHGRVCEQGYNIPPDMEAMKTQYVESNTNKSVELFVESHCLMDEIENYQGPGVKREVFHAKFCAWARDRGLTHPYGDRVDRFSRKVGELGIQVRRPGKETMYMVNLTNI